MQSCGLDVNEYHAKLDTEERKHREQQLINNDVKALVATVALGMGFDKPDLGFVVHYQRPGSLVAYYQQIGRAGRNLTNAYAILLSGGEDDEIQNYFIQQAFPGLTEMHNVLMLLEEADEGLSIPAILKKVNLSMSRVEKCIKLMEIEGGDKAKKNEAISQPSLFSEL